MAQEGHKDDEQQARVKLARSFLLASHSAAQEEWRTIIENDPWKARRMRHERVSDASHVVASADGA